MQDTIKLRVFVVLLLLAIVAGISGCTTPYSVRWKTHSHFVYPNANVTELGPVNVKMTVDSSFFVACDVQTAEMDLEVYQAALSQEEGANLLIDLVVITRVGGVPFYCWTTMEVDGTAARMEVGEQLLY